MFAIPNPSEIIPSHFKQSDRLLKESHEVLQDKDTNCFLRTLEGVMMAIQAVALRVFEAVKYFATICTQFVFSLIGIRPCDSLDALFAIPGALGAFITPFEIFGRAIGAIFTPKALEGAYVKKQAPSPPKPRA